MFTVVKIVDSSFFANVFFWDAGIIDKKTNCVRSQIIYNNLHIYFRARIPIQFRHYLPSKPFTPFSTMNRPVGGNIETGLSSIYTGVWPIAPQQPTGERPLFKIPAVPAPSNHRNPAISGSIESISSGYHSDSTPVGMGNIRKWLKSHRLHKYTWVFENVNYEKIFTFTEEYLKGLGITQGAAHKLAICIEKLQTRAETLKQTELSLTLNQMFVPEAIQIMESIVLSPMKPMRLNCNTDVGYQLWNVINLGEFLSFFFVCCLFFSTNCRSYFPFN